MVSDFPYHKELLLKERICSFWEKILSFKLNSHFEKLACSSSLPLMWVILQCSGYAIAYIVDLCCKMDHTELFFWKDKAKSMNSE